MTVERAGEGAGESRRRPVERGRVRWVVGDGGVGEGAGRGSAAAAGGAGEGAVDRRRRWSGGGCGPGVGDGGRWSGGGCVGSSVTVEWGTGSFLDCIKCCLIFICV